MIYNPTNIIKCLSTQATYIKPSYGTMYYYTDKAEIWYDTQNNNRILANDIFILYYERERVNFIPEHYQIPNTENTSPYDQTTNFIYVYVIETNSLYQYNYNSKTWVSVYGTWGKDLVAQTYYPDGDFVKVFKDDVSVNGILNNGSVVVRDKNMMICGLLLSDGYTFTIKSLIGGQLNLDPSGIEQGEGCLQLNSKNKIANLNGNLVVFGDIMVTSSENWNKQYSLVTQDIQISSYCLIKKGSTIKLGSQINGEKYTIDTVLTDDLETTQVGLIVSGSKLYMNSVINGDNIKPPFMFDIPDSEFRRL